MKHLKNAVIMCDKKPKQAIKNRQHNASGFLKAVRALWALSQINAWRTALRDVPCEGQLFYVQLRVRRG
jgi:hypothetical protein